MMTKNTILNAIATFINDNDNMDMVFATDGDKNITGADVMDYITKEKATLAKRNETAKARNAAKKADADNTIMEAIRSALDAADMPLGTTELANAVSDIVGKTITWQKAARVANAMNDVEKSKVKVDKKMKTVYTLVSVDDAVQAMPNEISC